MKWLRLLKVIGPTWDVIMDYKHSKDTSKIHIPTDQELLEQVFKGDLVPDIRVEVDKILDSPAMKNKFIMCVH